MSSLRLSIGLPVAVALFISFGIGGSAVAGTPGNSDPECGGTVTRSLTLQHDLLNCVGAGLLIGGDAVVLDLGGHTISAAPMNGAAGIEVASRRAVTIRGGTIRGFRNGVEISESQAVIVQSNQILDNSGVGVFITGGTGNVVTSSRIGQISDTGAGGILLFQTTANTLTRNTLYRNGDGVSVVQSSGNTITLNNSSRSGAGIGLFDHALDNLVSLNVTDDNTDTGVLLDQHADHNRLIGNISRRNAFAGIAVGASDHNDVLLNITSRNLGAGIAIVDAAAYTTVNGNVADSNGYTPPGCVPDCPLLDDGIHVDAALTYLNNNVADGNADLGIDAAAAVLGGQHNRARLNVDPRQCTGVTCR